MQRGRTDIMARMSLDDKIKKQEEAVFKAKDRYEAELKELDKLIAKRREIESKELVKAFEKEGLPVGHVKAIVENGSQFAVSNLTQDSRTVTLRGDAGKGTEATLVINARVETTPEHLDELVRAELKQLLADKYEQTELAWKFLQPGRPNPTHRFVEIV